MKKIKNKLGFKLFYNDKFVMFFSILVAFIAWVGVSSTSEETTIFTVTDIPVTLPELTNDLRYYGADDLTADVKISGNALVVTSVTGDDIYITASDVSHITDAGIYTIDLIPKKSGIKTDYSFESSVSPSNISVYVDGYAEKEITINDKIVVNSVAADCYASQTVLSQQTVKLTGAESVINSIVEADAEYTFMSSLSETTVVKAPIVFYDSAGNKVESSYINADISEVDATVPILQVLTVNITPNLTNVPGYLNASDSFITVEPSTIRLAVPSNASLDEIYTSAIDFSKVDLTTNKFEVDIEIPSGCKNIDGTEKATVTFDTSEMTTKTLTVSKFTIENEGAEQTAAVSTKSIKVTLIGPKSTLAAMTASQINASIDISEKSTLTDGIFELPVSLSIDSRATDCWIQGSYTVNVSFSEKKAEESSTASSKPTSTQSA